MCLRLNLGKIHLSNHFELFLRFFDNKKKEKNYNWSYRHALKNNS